MHLFDSVACVVNLKKGDICEEIVGYITFFFIHFVVNSVCSSDIFCVLFDFHLGPLANYFIVSSYLSANSVINSWLLSVLLPESCRRSLL